MHALQVISTLEMTPEQYSCLVWHRWLVDGYVEYQIGQLLYELRSKQAARPTTDVDIRVITGLDDFLMRHHGLKHGQVILIKHDRLRTGDVMSGRGITYGVSKKTTTLSRITQSWLDTVKHRLGAKIRPKRPEDPTKMNDEERKEYGRALGYWEAYLQAERDNLYPESMKERPDLGCYTRGYIDGWNLAVARLRGDVPAAPKLQSDAPKLDKK